MASLILGVTGKKRSGKDTFAGRLIEKHGFTRVAFADPLKAVAYDLNPYIIGETYRLAEIVDEEGWEKAKEYDEIRRTLQALGVAVRDHVSPSAWVNAALKAANGIPGPVVITDVRFPNEVDAVRQCLGKLVKVVRPGLVSTDQHISETALDDVVPDFYVRNDGTIGDLHAFADGVARMALAGN